MTQNVAQILSAARALIQKPEHWTQHTFARDVSGEPVPAQSSAAFCWCTVGAIAKVTQGFLEAKAARDFLKKFTHVKLDRFNDSMTHKGVLDAFDRAIQEASEALLV